MNIRCGRHALQDFGGYAWVSMMLLEHVVADEGYIRDVRGWTQENQP